MQRCRAAEYAPERIDTDKGLLDSGFSAPEDSEATAIHKGSSKQRFDRFYISPGLKAEVASAMSVVGAEALVDSKREAANGEFEDFARNVSDHFAVILVLDVSRERP